MAMVAYNTSLKPLPPISFDLSDAQPDVHLQVFNQPFHVHSIVLKTHSEFFRKYLDSPEKTIEHSKFRYEWITKVDQDGTWSLIWKHCWTDRSELGESTYKGDSLGRIEALNILLQTFYSRQITISSVEQLQDITELADYYRALPTFNLAVTSAMFTSTGLTNKIPENCLVLLEVATTLKNPILFRECLIHATGPFHEPQYLRLKNEKLKQIVGRAYDGIFRIIVLAQQALLMEGEKIYAHGGIDRAQISQGAPSMISIVSGCMITHGNGKLPSLPRYYSKLAQLSSDILPKTFAKALEPLLKSNLVFQKHGVGLKSLEDTFLCAMIKDEEMPWELDLEEVQSENDIQ